MFTYTARKVLTGAAVLVVLAQLSLLLLSTVEYIQIASRAH